MLSGLPEVLTVTCMSLLTDPIGPWSSLEQGNEKGCAGILVVVGLVSLCIRRVTVAQLISSKGGFTQASWDKFGSLV